MKILHIITGLGDGGAEAVLYRLCTHDTAHQHEVVSLMDAGKYGPLLQARGVVVHCLGLPRGRVRLAGLWRLWRLIRRARPDAIQTWMYHADLLGGVIGRLAGQRNIHWGVRNTTLVPGKSSRKTILVSRLCARLSRHVPRKIVCCGNEARRVHAQLGYDSGRMCVIPNGYDLDLFRPDPAAGKELRAQLGLAIDEPVIGFVARYDAQKDHDTLLRALAVPAGRGNCPRCLLVGSGMDSDNVALGAKIADLGLRERVHLLGRRTDIPAVMNALDLHVMSSGFGEAFPNVLAEAMACGTPCVSTDVGDAAVILGDTGQIVPPRAPEALADAIEALLAERGTPAWKARREAARHHISERFAVSRMVEDYHMAWFGTGPESIPKREIAAS